MELIIGKSGNKREPGTRLPHKQRRASHERRHDGGRGVLPDHRPTEALQADQNSLARRPLPSPQNARFFPRRRIRQAMMHRALVAACARHHNSAGTTFRSQMTRRQARGGVVSFHSLGRLRIDGAHASYDQTTRICNCDRRRDGRMAARGARAVGDAGSRVPP